MQVMTCLVDSTAPLRSRLGWAVNTQRLNGS